MFSKIGYSGKPGGYIGKLTKKYSRRKERMKKLLAYLLMLTFVFVLVGCGEKGKDKDPDGTDPIVNTDPKEIKITGAVSVAAGSKIQLTATVLPATASQEVTWESVKPEVASVSATGEVTGVSAGATVIRAISKVKATVTKQHVVQVTSTGDVVYPDLGGYTIRIAQAGHALNEIDPFHAEYKALNKEAKKNAWDWVEENFNVNIEVVPYPDYAEWGAPRWNYIEQQAQSQKAEYDFYIVPDSQIGRFVEARALHDITSWYTKYTIKHQAGYMDEVYRQSGTYKGSIYSITDGSSGIYNVMYYNVNLLERLGMEKTPAEMFNDGDWTYSAFKDYAIEAQTKLNALDDGKTYYAVAGNSPYYWAGMSNAGGVKLADVSALKINVKDPIAIQAADTLKAIFDAKAMDPAKQVDAGVTSWMDNRALFASGDLWFVNTSNRWPEDLWGEGDATRYGYVPFPRPDGTAKEDQKIGLGGTATFVMPMYRDYSGYTADLNAENVYYAIFMSFVKTEEFQKNDPSYNEDVLRRANAQKYTATEDSVEAFIYISKNIKTAGFYDPMSIPDNPIVNTGYSTFSTNVNKYIMGVDFNTFAEAVDTLIPTLQEALTKAFT